MRSVRSLMMTSVVLWTACRTPANPEKGAGEQVETDGGDNGDLDMETTDPELDIERPDNRGTDNESEDSVVLEIEWATTFGAAEAFRVRPGQKGVLLSMWWLRNSGHEDIEVYDLTVMGYADGDLDGRFLAIEEDGRVPGDYFENCTIENPAAGRELYMGPISFEDPYGGWTFFSDNFMFLGDHEVMAIGFYCDVREDVVVDRAIHFAFDIQTLDLRTSADQQIWTGHNIQHLPEAYVSPQLWVEFAPEDAPEGIE